jgi:hypothetical protein
VRGGWGGGVASRLVSGNDGGPVAREPATGGRERRCGNDMEAGKENKG